MRKLALSRPLSHYCLASDFDDQALVEASSVENASNIDSIGVGNEEGVNGDYFHHIEQTDDEMLQEHLCRAADLGNFDASSSPNRFTTLPLSSPPSPPPPPHETSHL